jgi:hypothetical protein
MVQAQGVYVMPTTGYVTPFPVGNPFMRPAGVFNYGGLIQAQQQLTTTIQQFQQQLVAGQTAQGTQDTAGGLPVTGHPAGFFNTSHYFYNLGTTGGVLTRPGNALTAGVGFFPARPATGILAARAIR